MEPAASPLSSSLPAFESAAPSLSKDDVERFGRQMLVEEIGPAHMAEIKRGRVVCVGAGGLGSTILLYLAAAGVGQLTIVDFDSVEVSNLHRQVIHQSAAVGRPKAESAKEACLRLVPTASITAITSALTPANAERLLRDCDVVVDGTDNVAARYLVNDAAMRLRKPLVSGSAMGWDGQLSVYGYRDGPCYRCLFPQPPPPATVGSCNDTGVVGPLPGMIGCLQALETLKVLTNVGDVLSGRMFTFNGLRFATRVVRLRGKQPDCAACSSAALASMVPLTEMAGTTRPEYIPASCASATPSDISLSSSSSCSVTEFATRRTSSYRPAALTLDVRVRLQYDMAHLPDSLCVPYQTLQQWERAGQLAAQLAEVLNQALAAHTTSSSSLETAANNSVAGDGVESRVVVFVLCRRGINSVKAVELIQGVLNSAASLPDAPASMENPLHRFVFRNVEGGLNAYHSRVDARFPYY